MFAEKIKKTWKAKKSYVFLRAFQVSRDHFQCFWKNKVKHSKTLFKVKQRQSDIPMLYKVNGLYYEFWLLFDVFTSFSWIQYNQSG